MFPLIKFIGEVFSLAVFFAAPNGLPPPERPLETPERY